MDGPWHIDISPWQSWVGGTSPIRTQSSLNLGGGRIAQQGVGKGAAWDVPLTAGTWTLTSIYEQYTGNDPAITVKFDSTTVGVIDQTAGSTANAVNQITGIVVGADAVVRLSYTGDPAAPTLYFQLNHVTLTRTA